MGMSERYELAGRLCRAVQARRLDRIGERLPPDTEINPLDALPDYEQQNWLDMADAMLTLSDEQPKRSQTTALLTALMDDWDRYGVALASEPEHRDSMRRAVIIEARVLLDKLWIEADGDRY